MGRGVRAGAVGVGVGVEVGTRVKLGVATGTVPLSDSSACTSCVTILATKLRVKPLHFKLVNG